VPDVAVLIPARNESANIGACLDAALASAGADIEVIVLDDGSTDDTADIVRRRAQTDPRLRLEAASPLPPGWKGKCHACETLSTLTNRPFLLFVDADVRLAPDAAARLTPPDGVDFVSGVPRQEVHGVMEGAVVPMINTMIMAYLPIAMMRAMPEREPLAAACGQLIMVRASAYRASGGHRAIAGCMHDGLMLARLFRRAGFRTDLVDATSLATCRMYRGAAEVWQGFGKNATEGMARPLALPIWTVLLLGGWLMPLGLSLLAVLMPQAVPFKPLLLTAAGLLIGARILQAWKCREPWFAVVLCPLGVLITIVIQWWALAALWRGRKVHWRGRDYSPSF
jgi:glycosyltransferase involved in cell wall biosynthesis